MCDNPTMDNERTDDKTDDHWEKKPPESVRTGANDEYYHMNSKEGRYAIIFNHLNFKEKGRREGTELDKELLEGTLRSKKFEVEAHEDATKDEVINRIKTVSEMKDFSYDCILVAILTHGGMNGKLSAYDGQYQLNDIIQPFVGKFPDKPKLFLVQACRGSETAKGIPVRTATDSAGVKRNYDYSIPEEADFYFMYSIVDEHYSLRRRLRGSYFIQSFCEHFKEKASTTHLEDIMTDVRRDLSTEEVYVPDLQVYSKIIPHCSTTLRRKILF